MDDVVDNTRVTDGTMAQKYHHRGTVIALNCDSAHRFSKPARQSVRLVEGHGIEGDAHAGQFIKHRYLAKRTPCLPNNRQVHLIQSELFDELKLLGYEVRPGQLGENITTKDLDLLELPLGTFLHLGNSAVGELTGLRTPCGYIDRFQKGLKRAMIVRTETNNVFRAGVLGVVRKGGELTTGDPISRCLSKRQVRQGWARTFGTASIWPRCNPDIKPMNCKCPCRQAHKAKFGLIALVRIFGASTRSRPSLNSPSGSLKSRARLIAAIAMPTALAPTTHTLFRTKRCKVIRHAGLAFETSEISSAASSRMSS